MPGGGRNETNGTPGGKKKKKNDFQSSLLSPANGLGPMVPVMIHMSNALSAERRVQKPMQTEKLRAY